MPNDSTHHRDQADVLRRMKSPSSGATIAVVGAKGGVGTSVVTLALAEALASYQSVLVLDANWGQSDLALLARLSAREAVAHCTVGLAELLEEKETDQQSLAAGITLVPGANGDFPQPLAEATGRLFKRLAAMNAGITLLDTGVASTRWAQALAAHADQTLLVATPDQHAVVSAYASAKRLRQTGARPFLVWNGCPNANQAETAQQRIRATCESAGKPPLASVGWLPGRMNSADKVFAEAARYLALSLTSDTVANELQREHSAAA